jgi:hypothetical protein
MPMIKAHIGPKKKYNTVGKDGLEEAKAQQALDAEYDRREQRDVTDNTVKKLFGLKSKLLDYHQEIEYMVENYDRSINTQKYFQKKLKEAKEKIDKEWFKWDSTKEKDKKNLDEFVKKSYENLDSIVKELGEAIPEKKAKYAKLMAAQKYQHLAALAMLKKHGKENVAATKAILGEKTRNGDGGRKRRRTRTRRKRRKQRGSRWLGRSSGPTNKQGSRKNTKKKRTKNKTKKKRTKKKRRKRRR